MKKTVNYKVSGKEWEEAKDKAFKEIAKNAKVDGFRKGKVPRNIFEKKYGTSDILREAMENLINKRYTEVMVEEKLIPVLEPSLNIKSLDDKGFEVDMVFILDPEVKLGEYKGLKVKKDKVKVTKEEIEHELSHILDHYAELTVKEGEVEDGDTVIIDFKGFKDGKEFEGGSAENYTLEIGSHSFIPGFEEGIIGMKREESKDLELTFPKDYMVEDLKGQKVVFNVVLHDIKTRVVPELDEEFFKDLDMEGVTNKEELEKVIEEEIKAQKEADADNKFIDELLKKASDNMKIEIDTEIIDAEVDRMYKEFIDRMQMQGVSEELYFAYTGTKKEDVLKEMEKEAENRVKYRYLLEAIAKEEKIEVTDEEAHERLHEMMHHYNMEEDALLKELGGMDVLKYDTRMRKAIEVLKDNN